MTGQPRIIFYTHWKEIPDPIRTGGQRVVLQHVRMLMQEGYDVRVVVTGWFSSHPAIPTVRLGKLDRFVRPDDFLVVPTIHSGRLDDMPVSRKVILNQNGPLFLSQLSPDVSLYPWHRDDVAAAICVSEDDVQIMRSMGAPCPIYRVYNRVDTSGVEPLPWTQREDLICTPPLIDRKNRWHSLMLGHLARARLDVRIVEILGMEPPRAMETLARAKLFLFPSIAEGFGLLPLEAAYLRVPVLAFRHQPCREFLPEDFLIAPGDIESAWSLMRLALCEGGTLDDLLDQAQSNAWNYTPEIQRKSVLDAWSCIVPS